MGIKESISSTLDARRSTLDARRSTLDARRSTLDARRSTLDARRAKCWIILYAISFLFGAAVPARADAPLVIDWAKGDVQDTKASCGAFAFKNLPDRRATSLWMRGTASGTCSFSADGLTFHLPPNYGATIQGTTTFFAFERVGADVLVTWTPGY